MSTDNNGDDGTTWFVVDEEAYWTFEGYWNAVLSPLSPERVVAEYELDPSDRRGLDEWLGTAEEAAATAGGIEIPESWEPFHLRALDMLCAVAEGDEIAHEITRAVRELRRLIWAHADAEGPERAVIAAQIASLSKRTSIYRIPLNAGDVPPVGLHITLAQGGRDLERFEGDGEFVIPACVNGHYYYAQHDAQSDVESLDMLCAVAETLDVDAIKSAVERSISHTESAEVAVPSWEAALPALKSVAGELELDWCELEPGRYDVWAFDAAGPEGEMAWRLTVVADDGGAP